MGRVVVVLTVVAVVGSIEARAGAQDFCLNEGDVALALSIDREIQASVGLQVLSALLGAGGAAAIPIDANVMSSSAPSNFETGFTWFVGGIVIVSLAAIALGVGIGLEVDGISRGVPLRARLRRARELRSSGGGLAIAF